MGQTRFEPCPHCHLPLSYLEGVSGSQMDPPCPRCRKVITVTRKTFLMADYSRPSAPPKAREV